MTKQSIKDGDVVRIPSSNQLMTVGYVDGHKAFCVWFKDGEVRECMFYLDSLIKADPV